MSGSGQKKTVMDNMLYQIWKVMENEDSTLPVSARHMLDSLPCLADVSLRMVQDIMCDIQKRMKDKQPPPPPRRLLFNDDPLASVKKCTVKRR